MQSKNPHTHAPNRCHHFNIIYDRLSGSSPFLLCIYNNLVHSIWSSRHSSVRRLVPPSLSSFVHHGCYRGTSTAIDVLFGAEAQLSIRANMAAEVKSLVASKLARGRPSIEERNRSKLGLALSMLGRCLSSENRRGVNVPSPPGKPEPSEPLLPFPLARLPVVVAVGATLGG